MSSVPPPAVDRSAVLAHRVATLGLHRTALAARDLPALGLGVQDSPPGTARVAVGVRVSHPDGPGARWEDDASLALAWTVRGAPHVHRVRDLPLLAAAGRPVDDADAAARLSWTASRLRGSERAPTAVLDLAAAAVRDVVRAAADEPEGLDLTGLPVPLDDAGRPQLVKGLLSREVSRRLPDDLRPFCRPCGSHHVSDQVLRLVALRGGLRVVDPGPPLVFGPAEGAGPQDALVDPAAALGELVRAYLQAYAPATPADAATFVGAARSAVQAVWPPDAVEVAVTVPGAARPRRAWALPADVDALADPPEPPVVRLLPPNDAFTKAGDRDVLVPDRAEQKVLWRILGSPGTLLVDGLPAGAWRPRSSGRRLDVVIEPFTPLDPPTTKALQREAEHLATTRNQTLNQLTAP